MKLIKSMDEEDNNGNLEVIPTTEDKEMQTFQDHCGSDTWR